MSEHTFTTKLISNGLTICDQPGLHVNFIRQLGLLKVGRLSNGKVLKSTWVLSQELGHIKLGVLVPRLQLEGDQDLTEGRSRVPGQGLWHPVLVNLVDDEHLLWIALPMPMPELQVDTIRWTRWLPSWEPKVGDRGLVPDVQLPSPVSALVWMMTVDIAGVELEQVVGDRGESVVDGRIVDLDQAEGVVLLVSVGQPDVRLARTSTFKPSVRQLPSCFFPTLGVRFRHLEAVLDARPVVGTVRPVVAQTPSSQALVPVSHTQGQNSWRIQRKVSPQGRIKSEVHPVPARIPVEGSSEPAVELVLDVSNSPKTKASCVGFHLVNIVL